jgi:hypothetical protein
VYCIFAKSTNSNFQFSLLFKSWVGNFPKTLLLVSWEKVRYTRDGEGPVLWTNIDNELHCYSNEFHSHLPFHKLWPNHQSKVWFGLEETALILLYLVISLTYVILDQSLTQIYQRWLWVRHWYWMDFTRYHRIGLFSSCSSSSPVLVRAFFNIQAGGANAPPVPPCAPPTKSHFAPPGKVPFS